MAMSSYLIRPAFNVLEFWNLYKNIVFLMMKSLYKHIENF
jgi:hypothetical protein